MVLSDNVVSRALVFSGSSSRFEVEVAFEELNDTCSLMQ